jgi:predicted nucleic acid-binding protein
VILVDTSVWIDWLSDRPRIGLRPDDLQDFATCGPVVQEVVQGLWPGVESDVIRQAFLAMKRLSDPIPIDHFLTAAEIYQLGRRKGFTIRSSVDCLIAAIAIEHRVPIWHQDRDFTAIARFTALEIYTGPEAPPPAARRAA